MSNTYIPENGLAYLKTVLLEIEAKPKHKTGAGISVLNAIKQVAMKTACYRFQKAKAEGKAGRIRPMTCGIGFPYSTYPDGKGFGIHHDGCQICAGVDFPTVKKRLLERLLGNRGLSTDLLLQDSTEVPQ